MRTSTIRRLDTLFGAMPMLLGGSVSSEDIDLAEQKVGMRFAPDDREFLLRYGSATVGSLPIFGLRQAEVMADDTYSVIDVTVRFRADGWGPTSDWVVMSMDLAGNPIGLTPEGEVWISDHNAGEARRLAPTFEDFLIQQLDE